MYKGICYFQLVRVVFISIIHSHLKPYFSWCFKTASLLGASRRQYILSTSLLYIMLSWVTPNSSIGDRCNFLRVSSSTSFKLWTSRNFGNLVWISVSLFLNVVHYKENNTDGKNFMIRILSYCGTRVEDIITI